MYLIGLGWVKLLGGLYLLYLAYAHFSSRESGAERHAPPKAKAWLGMSPFWSTVVRVELVNLAFSIDSILVAVAVSPKLWVVLTGGILGIVVMRLVVGQLIALIERYPALVDGAFVVIAWVAIKLLAEYLHAAGYIAFEIPRWVSLGLIVVILGEPGSTRALKGRARRVDDRMMPLKRLLNEEEESFRTDAHPPSNHLGLAGRGTLVVALIVSGAASVWWLSRYTLAVRRLTRGVGDTMFYGADGRPWFRLDEQRHDVPLAEIAPISSTPSSRSKIGVSTIIPGSTRSAWRAPSPATSGPAAASRAAARSRSSSPARCSCRTSGRSAARRRKPGSRSSSSSSSRRTRSSSCTSIAST